MSSRADSTSPPPYSFEPSSFPPPPPRAGDVARNWSFQAKFEAAKEPVRQAILDTITAWTFSETSGESWDFIPRQDVQDAYDAAAVDLRKALDFIIENKYAVYLRDDMDRRRHEYFHRMDGQESSPRVLPSPQAFADDFDTAHVEVQIAVLRTFALWKSSRGGKHVRPLHEHVRGEYERAPIELKTLLEWVLASGSVNPVRHSRDVRNFEKLEKSHLQRSIMIRTSVQPFL
ncbi:unnamed protein product [Peniophora sp. CBMAI 1063]|nr:unnamed protein product [Peniophora sp. CBMAI 1063]